MRNYQRELDVLLEKEDTKGKKLFLHSCCAPCSSYVLVYLRGFFRIQVFYYNPNITEREEYEKRVAEEMRLIDRLNEEAQREGILTGVGRGGEGLVFPITVQRGSYEPELFFERTKGLEDCREGGERCRVCFGLRQEETAREAKAQGFDYFTTTLTVSPLKNAKNLNEIGEEMGRRYGVAYLCSDFKKREGYRMSVELSKKYDLYRQDYCGCVFSRAERNRKKLPPEK